jgi:NAD(P)-dependent dehydrogenase (short-subunit alcohol dehydrogenase family)
MEITDTIALVTGANRGLGRALVTTLLDRGAARVYAAARDPLTVAVDPRITPLRLDLTDLASVEAAAAAAGDVDLLVNNAGAAHFGPALTASRADLLDELTVNYLGLHATITAFLPTLARRNGAVVNVLTLLSHAPAPVMAGYSASKAAGHSLTLSLRPALARQGVRLHAVYPGGIDTDMLAGFDAPKADALDVAGRILDGVAKGELEIFPDDTSAQMGEIWARDPRAFAAAFAAMDV